MMSKDVVPLFHHFSNMDVPKFTEDAVLAQYRRTFQEYLLGDIANMIIEYVDCSYCCLDVHFPWVIQSGLLDNLNSQDLKAFFNYYHLGLSGDQIVLQIFDKLTSRLCERFDAAPNWVIKTFFGFGDSPNKLCKMGIREYCNWMKRLWRIREENRKGKDDCVYFRPLQIWIKKGTKEHKLAEKYFRVHKIGHNNKEHPEQVRLRHQILAVRRGI